MYRRSTFPRRRRFVGATVLALFTLAACGSETSTTPEADATTLAPGTTTIEDDAVTTDDEPDAEEPSDTLRPPEEPATSSTTAPAPGATTVAGDPDESVPSAGGELSASGQAMADIAVADVVERRGVEPTAVTVVAVEEVTWPDGSRGCPQRDMQYQQVLTPGVRVILEVDGQRAFYHGSSAADLAYCAAPRPPLET